MAELLINDTPLAGVFILLRKQVRDARGHLERLFDAPSLASLLEDRSIVQVNKTCTEQPGTVRGLHVQLPPNAETKVVSCLRGSVFDVAVDLRAGSSTFGEWFGCELSADNGQALWIPEGCAHGVQTLEPDCELLYLHTAAYSPESEVALNPLSSDVGIDWPREISRLSDRDAFAPAALDVFQGVDW
jgi:dTDP-4-dehydrorhamnose 3,5-epimerase